MGRRLQDISIISVDHGIFGDSYSAWRWHEQFAQESSLQKQQHYESSAMHSSCSYTRCHGLLLDHGYVLAWGVWYDIPPVYILRKHPCNI